MEKGDKLLIGCIYRSPNTSGIADEEIRNLILSCSARSNSHLLLMGDFNYPEISWDPIRMPKDHMHPATLFVEGLRDAYLYQHVTNPTHSRAEQKANTLDLILTNEESMVEDLTHEPPLGKSHHDCLVFKYRCYSKRNINVQRKFKLNLDDYKGLAQACNAINWDDLLNSEDITRMWNTLSRKLIELCKKYIPMSSSSLNNRRVRPVWWKKKVNGNNKAEKESIYTKTKLGNCR